MNFVCNSCYMFMEKGAMTSGSFVLTSCFHIYCIPCLQRMSNKVCMICKKQCQIVKIGKDMPPNLQSLFESPLAKLEKIHQQLRFWKHQQDIAFKLKEKFDEAQKKKQLQINKILEMEAKVKAEDQRWDKIIREKMETYRNVKQQYQKIDAEEKRLLKLFEDSGFSTNDEDVSADSGMFSFDSEYK